MSRSQAESIIKNLIREIVQECAVNGQAISETLVAFMVKAVVLDPRNDFSTEKTLTKDDVQKLINLCVKRLLDTKSPSMDTIKMQVFFDMNYTSRKEFMEEHKRVMEIRLQPVIREITDTRARTKDELESLYRKIVSSVLLRSGLGSPTDISIVREATAALQSVFPQPELGAFLSMNRPDKEKHLQELTSIVSGIRLFNKDCGKGGEGIDDLPNFLNEGIPATTANLNSEIQKAQQQCYKYTTLILKLEKQDPENLDIPLKLLKEAAINCRQQILFLQIILTDIIRSSDKVKDLINLLHSGLEKLHTTVQSKTAVPTGQVYPLFMNLSDIWTGFQDEMVILSVLTNILNNLENFTNGHNELFSDDYLSNFITSGEVKSDKDIHEESGSESINPKNYPNSEWLFPADTKNFEKLPLQYKGFCPVTLTEVPGLLVPGNTSMGILHHKDAYYAFSSEILAKKFVENSEFYLVGVADIARQNAELIQLLEMHQQFSTISTDPSANSINMIDKPVVKSNAECQTDTHFMDSCIVRNYYWNEWEMRRQAIKLANLRQKVTKSMQTNLSHFKRDNVAQVYLPKNQFSQTKRDNYSTIPKPSVFLNGLRGCGLFSETVYEKINLTIPVEQQLCGSNNGNPS